MRVLLTGASGFIGRHVLQSLKDKNIPCIAVGRKRPCEEVEFIAADLLEEQDFTDIIKSAQASHLVHLAWYAEHGLFWQSSLNWKWVTASTRLIEAFCAQGGHHVTVAGTCAEYDWSYRYCVENKTPLFPESLYGTAKQALHQIALKICDNKKIPLAWGRVFIPYGLGENRNRLIPSIIDTLHGLRDPFPINLDTYRDFLHVSDVAEAFVKLSQNNTSGCFNVASGEPTRLKDLVCLIASLIDTDAESLLALGHEQRSDPPLIVGENRQINSLGWHPQYTLTSGLRDYISKSIFDNYRSNLMMKA